MSDRPSYSEAVTNYTGGKLLMLEIGSGEGMVFLGLSGEGVVPVKCVLAPDHIPAIVRALQDARDSSS